MLISQAHVTNNAAWEELRNLIYLLSDSWTPNKQECGIEGPNGFECSRLKGHKGPHVACGTNQAYEIWEK